MTDETVADYDIRSPASRTLLTVIGTIIAVAMVIGLVLGVSLLMRDTKVTTSVVELGDSAQVVVNTGGADIEIVEGDDDVVTIEGRVTSGIVPTDYELGRRGDEIRVESGCLGWISPGCGVELTVQVPAGLPVVIGTTSGDIVAGSLTQSVLTLSTGSGDIDVSELSADEFSASSGSGDVAVSFASQPFAVKALTTSGDVTATVPGGDRTFDVVLESSSGEVSSDLESDVEGEGFVRVTSGSGDIDLGSS